MPPPSLELPALVVQAQTGDHQAFTRLVRRFQDMAVGYAYVLIGDFHLAQDAAQEAFVAAWTELPRLRDPGAFAGWFRRLVFMRSTRFTRARKSGAGDPEQLVGDDPVQHMERRARRQTAFRALAALPEEERLITTLFYIARYSHGEIGQFLNLSAATVNNRLRAARKRLQQGALTMARDGLQDNAPSRNRDFAASIAGLTQPGAMRTPRYNYGIEEVDGHDAWALFCASAAGDLARVQALLERDPALVNAQYWYQFPIHMAVRQGHADVVQLLLDHGADPGQSRYTYNSWDKLLDTAAQRGFTAVEKLLAAAMQQRFGYDPAFAAVRDAVRQRQPDRVAELLAAAPALATAADALGNGGLHWAALTRQVGLIDSFLDWGGAIDARRADAQTPVQVALNGDYWYKHWQHRNESKPTPAPPDKWAVIQHLLERGAEYSFGLACAKGDEDRVRQILQQQPRAAAQLDAHGASPLSYAAQYGHAGLVELLLQQGADPNRAEILAPRGRALFEAAAGNNLEIAQILLKAGADPNAEVDSSGTCLTIVDFKQPDKSGPMQKLLRDHGAVTPPWDMSVEDFKALLQTAEPKDQAPEFIHELLAHDDAELYDLFLHKYADHVAAIVPTDIWGGNLPGRPLIEKLLDGGMDPGRPNWIGRTFLHLCAEKGARDVAQLLLERGADLEAIDLESGGTPLAAAVRHEQKEMVVFLLQKGADPDAPVESPWATARACAREQEDDSIKE
ncbi:MAG: sigma-70 family RNA polymerase sigma factor [Candidatus Latescibacteria bacterium]|nr:sigma-70 family RNA polymerase sigma factor [Candidatus Latescibacterota bacterium]